MKCNCGNPLNKHMTSKLFPQWTEIGEYMKEIKIDVGETFRLIVPDKCIEITYQGNDKLRITKVINKWKAEKRDGELKKEDGHVPLFVGVGASKAPRPILNLFKNKEV